MNAMVFATKRAFHGALRVTRKPLGAMGLTAARFDLLYALWSSNRKSAVSTLQSELRRVLGVSASVVSRMLQSLEALGLVTRCRSAHDRRQRKVSLTERGLARIREAHQALVRAVKRLVCVAICFGKHRDADQRFIHMATLESYLSSLRKQFGDRATLYYPWGHPDD